MNDIKKSIPTLFLTLFVGIVFAQEKPNFLFVMLDDMAPDAIFHDRFDFLKMPNIQRLADEGAVFENMMVTTSLCSPSRASILTGTYAHVHEVRYNGIAFHLSHLFSPLFILAVPTL